MAGKHDGSSENRVIVGTTEGVALVDLDTGTFTPHPSNGSYLKKFERMNDGKCDPQGRLWLGSIARVGAGGADLAPGASALYVLDGWSATPTKVLEGVTVSNGIAWAADGKTMYYTDSPTFGVDAFDFDGSACALSRGFARQ